ncbi:PEP-CTERM sorting domain-containing protein [Aquabacterium sp.]|uniref:PEP-CTERM sorting domain-containing protein n=1 Tax=Aquabacterium sp. TaxID=1872578 RepID=UPI003D6D4AA7
MKFAFKSLVAAAAFVAAGVASATPYAGTWTVEGGSGSLTFSAGALSALSASGSSIITPGVVSVGFPGAGSANNAAYTKATGNVALTFTDATIDGDKLTSLTAANSLVNIRRSIVNDEDGTVSQKNVFMANFKVDLVTSTISANLYSNAGAGTALQSYGNLTIFAAANTGVVAGGTGGLIEVTSESAAGATGSASGALSGKLSMNNGTADIILASLGLDTTGDVADLVKNADWGATSASGTFTAPPAVPEPSTYALLIAGLATAGAVARRRKAA